MGSVINCSRVLVIDDDEKILNLLMKVLHNAGFETVGATNTVAARTKLNDIDIMIVDCMLPEENGIDFIKSIREQGYKTPAILLTALNSTDNKVLGFESGIDDYLTKPFDERELIARLKRMISKNTISSLIQLGDCIFNRDTGELTKNSKQIHLSSTELYLLYELLKRPNQAISRNDLTNKLGTIVSDRTIDVQITRLRRKIGDNPKTPAIIQTIRHIGYSLIIKK